MKQKLRINKIWLFFALFLLLSPSFCTIKGEYNDDSEKYALLVAATFGTSSPEKTAEENEEARKLSYQYNLIDMFRYYEALINLGYDDEHIIILFSEIDGYPYPKDIDFDPYIMDKIDGPANKINIICEFLKFKTLDKNDQVFVMFIGHGLDGRFFLNKYLKWPNLDGYFGFNTYIALEPRFTNLYKSLNYSFFSYRLLFPYCALWDWELSLYTSRIKAKMIFLLGSCNSGGFVNNLGRFSKDRIIIAASQENELADVFVPPFRWAITGYKEPYNEEVNADINGDGKVSIAEAYIFAAEYANTHGKLGEQHALLEDNGDKKAHYFTNESFNPEEEGMDGYVSSNTFL